MSAVIDTAHQEAGSPEEARKIVLGFAHHLPAWLNETRCWLSTGRETMPLMDVGRNGYPSIRRLLRKIVRGICEAEKRAAS